LKIKTIVFKQVTTPVGYCENLLSINLALLDNCDRQALPMKTKSKNVANKLKGHNPSPL